MRALPLVVLALALVACGSSSGGGSGGGARATPTSTATSPPSSSPTATAAPARTPRRVPTLRTVSTGLHVPWGIAFLPGGDALVSERTTGKIVRIPENGGRARAVMTVPGVSAVGEGGLLGLALSPQFSHDKLIYAYLTTASDNRIVRFRLGGKVRNVVTGLQKSAIHNGGRIAFGPDGKLYAGVGDAGNTANAQNRSSLNGKILRMNPDGSVPAGNPFKDSLVWSWGHRNVQGLVWDRRGRLWATEFGQDTRDEVNLIRPGRNYGWPDVEGTGPTDGGRFTNPLVTWSTADASPSGDAIIGSNLYVAALRGECVWRIPLHGASLGKPTRMLAGRFGRIRTVIAAPDGTLWVATSNRDGRGSPRPGDDRIVAVKV